MKILRTAMLLFLAISIVTIGSYMVMKTLIEKPSAQLPQAAAPRLSGIAASSVVWAGHFGSKRSNPNIAYTLLGSGFFQAPTADNIDSLIKEWMADHPNAKLIPVTDYGPMMNDQPDSKLMWVWLVDGASNLNLDLVRKGACPGGTMVAPNNTDVLVPASQYTSFESKLPKLEKLARRKKIGIWKHGDRL